MYLLAFTVPESHLEIVKKAIFDAGAGKSGNYSHCCWQTLGEGQFMPLEGSQAFIGKINTIEKVSEYKVETLCEASCIEAVIVALKNAHPYEVPFYQVIKIEAF